MEAERALRSIRGGDVRKEEEEEEEEERREICCCGATKFMDVLLRAVNQHATEPARTRSEGAPAAPSRRGNGVSASDLRRFDIFIGSDLCPTSFQVHDDGEETDAGEGKRATWTVVTALSVHGNRTRMAICDEDVDISYDDDFDCVVFASEQRHESLPPRLLSGEIAHHRVIKVTALFWKSIQR